MSHETAPYTTPAEAPAPAPLSAERLAEIAATLAEYVSGEEVMTGRPLPPNPTADDFAFPYTRDVMPLLAHAEAAEARAAEAEAQVAVLRVELDEAARELSYERQMRQQTEEAMIALGQQVAGLKVELAEQEKEKFQLIQENSRQKAMIGALDLIRAGYMQKNSQVMKLLMTFAEYEEAEAFLKEAASRAI